MAEIMLVDLSSLAHPIYHVSQSDPDPNTTSIRTLAKVRSLAHGREHVAVCADSGRSFRHDIDPQYKGTRPKDENRAVLNHQVSLVREALVNDGFPVWLAKGFEADDVIASAAKQATAAGHDVLIVSADKDLLTLVTDATDSDVMPRVAALSLTTGEIVDAAAVQAKFGVKPSQMRDYLCLVGDTADNIKGAKDIGPKKAAAILQKFGSIDELYRQLDESGATMLKITPATHASLVEFRERLPTVRSLIDLRTDVEIPFAEVFSERKPKAQESFAFGDDIPEENMTELVRELATEVQPIATTAEGVRTFSVSSQHPALAQEGAQVPTPQAQAPVMQAEPVAPATAIVRREPVTVATPSTEPWERQLDPRDMVQAQSLATSLFQSRMFNGYGTPHAILSTILMGRSLGLDAMASLRGIFNVEGRHALSAQLMVALVLRSGQAEYFRPTEISDTSVTYETLRKGPGQKPIRLTHTMEMARAAGLVKPKSNWEKSPVDMMCARASARLARLVYPDILFNIYTDDEMRESHNGNA